MADNEASISHYSHMERTGTSIYMLPVGAIT